MIVRRGLYQVSIEIIRDALKRPLPGMAGQIKMAPTPHGDRVDRSAESSDCRDAGVLLLLYPYTSNSDRELHLVLTRRQEYPGVHSGQISFPGGRREDGESLAETAMREAAEEIGVSSKNLEIIGQLSCLYTPPSNFCIYPFVAFSLTRPNFQPDSVEVAEVIETPLSIFFNSANHKEEIWHFEKYGKRRIPFYDVFGNKVWGATAMILAEFLTLLEEINN